ncbi:MAG: hypothetical protein Q7O66_15365, partial [Dehalococcoidia bacterium]|nr:hypothetical protein [Dehalococcoidia bacterium]
MQNEGQLKAHHGISARPDPPKSKLPFGLTGDRFTLYAAILASLAFTLIIWLVGPRLQYMQHLPYAGFGSYYWQLAGQTTLGKVSAWVLYV